MIIDVADTVQALLEKAKNTTDANDALKFSQAACNAANARASMMVTPVKENAE